jgi:hypothetical protein
MEGYVGIADGSCRSIDNSEKAGISSLYETSVNCATHIFLLLKLWITALRKFVPCHSGSYS